MIYKKIKKSKSDIPDGRADLARIYHAIKRLAPASHLPSLGGGEEGLGAVDVGVLVSVGLQEARQEQHGISGPRLRQPRQALCQRRHHGLVEVLPRVQGHHLIAGPLARHGRGRVAGAV